MLRSFNEVKPCSAGLVLGWVTKFESPRVVIIFFPFFFLFLFSRRYLRLQNCNPCVTSFLLFINFLFLVSPWPYLSVHLHYRIHKQRDTSFELSSILWTVDVSNHLIMAWIFQKFLQLDNFVTFGVFFFFFGNRVRLNLYERALSCFREMRLL